MSKSDRKEIKESLVTPSDHKVEPNPYPSIEMSQQDVNLSVSVVEDINSHVEYSQELKQENYDNVDKIIFGNPSEAYGVLPNQIKENMNVIIVNSYQNFKTEPTLTQCQSCKKLAITTTKKKVNFPNLFCCLGLSCTVSPLAYIFFQYFRNKDINFQDADHFCSQCEKLIFKYNAC